MPSQETPRARQVLAADSRGPRDEQQDAALVLESPELGTALLMVSDGVGGNSGGRLASQTVMDMARKLWDERKGELSDPYADLGLLCRISHEQINEEGQRRGITPRATIVALYLTPAKAYWAHSGDSRLYHFRKGQLVERTEDHSLIQVMVNQGMVNEEEMGEHPDQGALLQSLGGEEYKEPAHGKADIGPDDGFLLCTDGFWERTPDAEMAALLLGPQALAEEQLQTAIETAVQRNGSKGDNVTAALALPLPPPKSAATATATASMPPPMPATATAPPMMARSSSSPALGKSLIAVLLVFVLLCALGVLYFLWGYLNKPIIAEPPPKTPAPISSEVSPAGKLLTAPAPEPARTAASPPEKIPAKE